MSSIILEIQADALNDNISIQSLLRKAYAVSIKLSIEESKQWIESEMNGYGAESNVPLYRKIKGSLSAFNPVRGSIPVQIDDNEIEDKLSVMPFRQSIGQIESIIDKHAEGFLIPFTGRQLASLQNIMSSDLPFRLSYSATSLIPIVDNVRNTILQWALKLEQEGVTGENLSFSTDEVRRASMSTNINIANFQGVLGDVKDSDLTQNLNMTITESNNFEQLAKYLAEHKIEKCDIDNLELAIETDEAPSANKQFGTNVSSWIGSMVSKAAEGSWSISLATAANVLGTGISKYYGLS
jgi:hypothetical protein